MVFKKTNLYEQVYQAIITDNFSHAEQLLQQDIAEQTATATESERQLALLYTILLEKTGDLRYVDASLALWRKILANTEFWKNFTENYLLENFEQLLVPTQIPEEINLVLSDLYTNHYLLYQQAYILKKFHQFFAIRGKQVEKHILQPLQEEAVAALTQLQQLSCNTLDFIASFLSSLFTEIERLKKIQQKLESLGLLEDSAIIILSDTIANTLQIKSMQLHNQLTRTSEAIVLLEHAYSFAGTTSLKARLSQQLDALQRIQTNILFEPITVQINQQHGKKAITTLKNIRINHPHNLFLQQAVTKH